MFAFDNTAHLILGFYYKVAILFQCTRNESLVEFYYYNRIVLSFSILFYFSSLFAYGCLILKLLYYQGSVYLFYSIFVCVCGVAAL